MSNQILAQKTSLVVDLKKEVNPSVDFDEDLVDFQFNSLFTLPTYERAILDTYRGLPKCDSLNIYIHNVDNLQFYFDLYREKYLEKERFLRFIQDSKIDTLRLSSKPINQKLVAVIGFEKSKQFIITDANQNMDFSDDIKYEYSTDSLLYSNGNLKNLDRLPLSNYTYEVFNKGKIYAYSRTFIPYPNSNHVFSQSLSQTEKKYLSFIKFRDYWKGATVLNDKIYDFFVQATDSEYAVVYIKQKEIPLSKTDKAYNRQFMHRIKDTIVLGDNSYVLDSLNQSISKLYLTPLARKPTAFGYSIGQSINNFELKDLEHDSFSIFDVAKEKKYTLIEFWGTWCAPCLEMLPEIKKAAALFSSQLTIISIAFDETPQKVSAFTKKHEMNWPIAFLDRKKENPIINDLRIQIYPTFILIDASGTILWRGSASSFEEILKILKI